MPDLDGFELAAMLREHPRYETHRDHLHFRRPPLRPRPRARLRDAAASTTCRCRSCRRSCAPRSRSSPSSTARPRQLEKLNDELERRVRSGRPSSKQSTRAAARERGASAAGQRGRRVRHLRLQRRRRPDLLVSNLRRIVGIAGRRAADARKALGLVHPDHREEVRQHILGRPRTGGPPRARVQDRPRRRRDTLAAGPRPGRPR